jgi:RNA recognition motif-containing protein
MVTLLVVCFFPGSEFGSRICRPLEPYSWFLGPLCIRLEVGMATKLFVGNLPFSATGAELEGLFGQVGRVTSANVISDKFSGQSRGFGFVEMDSAQEAQTAIEKFNGYELQGRALTVNEAKPQENRGGGGGRSFGGNSGSAGGRDQRW